MHKYDLPARHGSPNAGDALDATTLDALWQLFSAICERWQNVAEPLTMKSRLLQFVHGRVLLRPEYASHYRTAAGVIAELQAEHGAQSFEFLFTDAAAGKAPPQTRLQITRQLVSNEFISLQLSLGSFKAFTGAINYPGYIAGWNGDGPAPYRTAQTKDDGSHES